MTTPTNDAPVTVEQCDRDEARDFMFNQWPKWDTEYDGVLADITARLAGHRLAALASAPADPTTGGNGKRSNRFCDGEPMPQDAEEAAGWRANWNGIGRGELPRSDKRSDAWLRGHRARSEWVSAGRPTAALASAPAGDGVEEAATEAAFRAINGPDLDPFTNPESWAFAEEVARAVAAALARPRAAVGEQSREEIARIIDPEAFGDYAAQCENDYGNTLWPLRRTRSLEKADAILGLQPPPAKVEG